MRRLADPALIAAAVLYGVLLQFATLAGLPGLVIRLLLVLSLWRYCYAVLQGVAQGKRELATVGMETMNPVGDWRLVLHFIAFPAALIALAIWVPLTTPGLEALLGWLAMLAIAALFPASAALMAVAGSLEAAFNPAAVSRVVTALGRDYARLLGAGAALVLGALWLDAAVLSRSFVAGIAGSTLLAWALLGLFALTGEALRAHRGDFVIPGEKEPDEERRAREVRTEWRKVLDEAYGALRSGLAAEGYETLRRLTASQGDSLEVHYWLFENMLGWEDRSHALAVARRLIDRHLTDGDRYPAFELFLRCRRAAPGFTLSAEAAQPLAELARSLGRDGVADELLAAAGSVR